MEEEDEASLERVEDGEQILYNDPAFVDHEQAKYPGQAQ